MDETPEPTPPTERPLPGAARGRIRTELLAAAQEPRAPRTAWLVPAGAAAAVGLVAVLAWWAIDPGDRVPHQGSPAVAGGSASPTPQGASTSAVPTPATTMAPSVPASEEPEGHQVGTGSCPAELKYVLKGAAQTFEFPPETEADGGSTAIFVRGDQFSLCDSREGATTVTHPLPLSPREEVGTYRVISLFPPTSDGYQTIRVAGGPVPKGMEDVFHVEYTFPDGHTQVATTSTDDTGRQWWLMVYRYDDGGGNETKEPPIEVTVSYSGAQHHYTLAWGVDTCAQANHGC